MSTTRVEGDYEHFLASNTGHVVIVTVCILAVLYIRLMWMNFWERTWSIISFLCCLDSDDDDDEEEKVKRGNSDNMQMDTSTSSQTPMNPSNSDTTNSDVEMGSHNPKIVKYLQPFESSAEEDQDGNDESFETQNVVDVSDFDCDVNNEYQQYGEYYGEEYDQSQYIVDNQYCDESEQYSGYDSFEARNVVPQRHPIHTSQQSIPVSSRRFQQPNPDPYISGRRCQNSKAPVGSSYQNIGNQAYSPHESSSRRSRVHPSRINWAT